MISIIGAGPAGCYTAYLLAKSGHEVQIFEKNKNVGHSVRCTGLVTPRINDFIRLKKEFIVNRIGKVKLNSESKSVCFKLKEREIVLDRAKFDSYLANMAEKAGAKIYLNHKFESFDGKTATIKSPLGIKKIETDLLIGADGPNSKIASLINSGVKNNAKEANIGMQARLKLKHEKNMYEVFLGENKGHFAWIVPEDENIVRAGMITRNSSHFRRFIFSLGGEVIDYPSGVIPLYRKMNLQRGNIFIVGDAAAQVKNTTGGGIFTGMLSAKILAESIINKKDYQKEFGKNIRKNLMMHDFVYRFMSNMKDIDYDCLLKILSEENDEEVVLNGERDFAARFAFRLFLSHPRLLLFLLKRIGYIQRAVRNT